MASQFRTRFMPLPIVVSACLVVLRPGGQGLEVRAV